MFGDFYTANDYYDQNQIKDIAKRGLVTETTFNLDSPVTSNNQYFILVRFYKNNIYCYFHELSAKKKCSNKNDSREDIY
jgi:hypothetical protein